jgi:hypothetical protein
MRIHPGVVATFLLAFVAETAAAADWWFVPTTPPLRGQTLVYVDKSSLQRSSKSSRVTARIWIIHRTDQTSEFGAYRSEKHLANVECEQKSYAADKRALYTAFGGLVHREAESPAAMSSIEPDSPAAAAGTFLCSDGKQPPRSIPVYDPSKDVEQRFLQSDRESN